MAKARQLNAIAETRGQSLAQMALAWVLRHPGMTSALIGAAVIKLTVPLVIRCGDRLSSSQRAEAIRELVIDDQRLRNDICWSVFDC